jgi:transcriptional regulator with XRE-family HTH domain
MTATKSLRQRREELGLSQETLGEKIGVDGMTVSRWERGESVPQKRFWPKLIEITSLTIAEIIAPPIAPTSSEAAE